MKILLHLLEYNFWANDQFIARLANQSARTAEMERLLSHLLLAHRIWLDRINARGTLPNAWETVDPQSWEGLNIQLYNETTDILKSHNPNIVVRYQNSRGESYKNLLWEILHHLVNHSTHHRAQLAQLMRAANILPPESDLIFYLREKEI